MSPPVFIIGGSRTGSELLKGIIEKYSDIAFVNEMHLLSPWWLHKDFSTVVRREAGGFGSQLSGEKVVELIRARRLFGYFWEEFSRVIDERKFCEAFNKTDKQLRDVLDISMRMTMEYKGKKTKGAKYPVHYSYVGKLIEWYPNCRIIHTVRDPRAIYTSQSTKYAKSAKGHLGAAIIRAMHFAHILIQTKWTYKIHQRFSNLDNYYLSVYEHLLGDTERYFSELCKFLDIEYVEEMKNPKVYCNSSFDSQKGTGKGLQRQAVNAYRNIINPATIKILEEITKREMKGFGYHTS